MKPQCTNRKEEGQQETRRRAPHNTEKERPQRTAAGNTHVSAAQHQKGRIAPNGSRKHKCER